MASVTYTITLNSGTNTDLPSGGVLTGYISSNGDSIPTGAYVVSASLYVSAMKCYTSRNARLQIGGYGTTSSFASNSSTHGESVSASQSDSILNVSYEGIELTVLSGSDNNTLNIRDYASVTLTVEYEIGSAGYSPSTGTLSVSSVEAGGQLTIALANSGGIGNCSHTVYWYCGSYNSTTSLSTGVSSASFTVPLSWMNAITTSTSGTGYVRVTTYVNSSLVGSNTYSYTITIPSSVVPTIGSQSATRIDNTVPSSWGIYVQNKSGVTITANNCAGAYGSKISSYVYSGGINTVSSSNSVTVNLLPTSGNISFTVRVTDSRGRSASKSISITVYEYSTPTLSNSAAFRSNRSGEASETGTYISAKTAYSYFSCNGKNSVTASVSYSVSGYDSWTMGATGISSNTSYVFGGGGISTSKIYQVKFVVTDAFTTVEKIMDVATSSYTLFLKRGGQAIGLGMENSSGATNVIEVNPEWEITRGGVNVFEKLASGGVNIVNNLTTTTAGSALDAYQGYVLNNKLFPKDYVIYSSNEPSVVNGAIWLKPV